MSLPIVRNLQWNGSGGRGQQLPLDAVPGAVLALGYDRMSRAWRDRPRVRIRRSGDNATRDFTVAELMDGKYLSGELITNGDFSDGATGWTLNYGGVVENGYLTLPQQETDKARARQAVLELGKIYKTEVTSLSDTGYLSVYGYSKHMINGPAAIREFRGVGDSTGALFQIWNNASNLGDLKVSNVSCREYQPSTAEQWVIDGGGAKEGYVVTQYDVSGNDNHATQATASYQPKIIENGAMLDGMRFDSDDYLSAPPLHYGVDGFTVVLLGVELVRTPTASQILWRSNSGGKSDLALLNSGGGAVVVDGRDADGIYQPWAGGNVIPDSLSRGNLIVLTDRTTMTFLWRSPGINNRADVLLPLATQGIDLGLNPTGFMELFRYGEAVGPLRGALVFNRALTDREVNILLREGL